MKKTVLVTGAAGFIGCDVSLKLLSMGYSVVGLDNINDYYSQDLKFARLDRLGINKESIEEKQVVTGVENYSFTKSDLCDKETLETLFQKHKFSSVIHLAAQAGVRYSIENPDAYIHSNIQGFLNILEMCRNNPVEHLAFASSSSVYGANAKIPFSVDDVVDHPVSLYAATKKSNELMAHTYSHLYGIPVTGLRFFTVYGPWGRPDMAPILFGKAILNGKAINVFNNGEMMRDFTYIDDIVEGVVRVMEKPPEIGGSTPAYRIANIGNGKPVKLLDFIQTLEKSLGVEAEKNMLPMQPGDVTQTWADTSALEKLIDFSPATTVEEGVQKFVQWIKQYPGFDSL